jgi:hypothetical protein
VGPQSSRVYVYRTVGCLFPSWRRPIEIDEDAGSTAQSKVIASEEQFRRAWSDYLAGGSLEAVPVHLRNFIGLRLAIARNAFGTAGQWVPQKKSISFDWSSKRAKPSRVGTAIVTQMIPGSPALTSVPYDRIIGGIRARERLEFADVPDWSDTL